MQQMSSLLAQHGLLLVFANVFLAQLGIPLPAIPMLIITGAFVAVGQLSFLALIGVTVVASLCGDIPWYLAGRRLGYRVLRTLCRIAIEPDSCVKQTENIFERWGPRSLLVAKYIPGFSTVAPPLAGAMQLNFGRFVVYSSAGALLWALVPIAAGMYFSAEVEKLLLWLESMGSTGVLVIAGVIGSYIGVKWIERKMLIRFLRTMRISVAELADMMGSKAPLVVLDVRSETARRLDPRRIPGAIAVNLSSPETFLNANKADHEVIVYCS
jgi:membrane protein DedA with SNARE-associated domain